MPRILIVDDDRATCEFIEELLAGPGREFVSSQDPGDAIRACATRRSISDHGLESQCRAIRPRCARTFTTERPSSPVILINGFGTLETAIDAVRAGAFDFISKPFEIGAVKATVERALRQPPKRPAQSRRSRCGRIRVDRQNVACSRCP